MAGINCPKCDAALDVEEDELDEGDTLSCDECGATLIVSGVSPTELKAEDDDDDFDDEDDDDFDDEDEDEDEEEEDEDWE